MKKIGLIILFLIINVINAYSQVLYGRVTKIKNGETFILTVTEIVDVDKYKIKVGDRILMKLDYINAPKSNHLYYFESSYHLKSLIFNKIVCVRINDKYIGKRYIGLVIYKYQNINLQMLKDGYAIYNRRCRDKLYHYAEFEAKIYNRGLWLNENVNSYYKKRRNVN